MSTCPPPLIRDPAWPDISPVHGCHAGCCVPCPLEYSLYPENVLDNGFHAASIARAISGVLMIYLFVSYMVLPNKRKHPSLLIFFATFSVMIFSLVGFFTAFKPRTVQCASEITKSTMYNNTTCGVQGTLLILGSFGSCVWIALIILNLHVHTVWGKQWMNKRHRWVSVGGWIYCIAFTVIAYAMGEVQYEFAELCLVSKKHSLALFFYPLAVAVFPAAILHMWTVIYIIRVRRQVHGRGIRNDNLSSTGSSKRARKTAVMAIVRLQWRAMTLAVAVTSALMFYWIFYFVDINKEPTSATQAAWMKCMLQGKGQNVCAKIVEPEVPSYQTMIAAEMVVSVQGTVFFIIFALQRSLVLEWKEFF
ncbi:hypothetical protein THASP1DRAFT_20807, partial [Thamnocephalis sphaerospora]